MVIPVPEPIPGVKLLDWFLPDQNELARHDDPDKIRRLGEDMRENGQLADVLATDDRRLISGHARLLAARAVGIKELRAKVYPGSLTDTQFRLIRASENLQRADYSGGQKWLLCADLMCGNPGWTQQDLARHLHLDPSMVTKLLSPSRLTPAWQEELKAGKVTIADCYAASKADPAALDGLLALKLGGAGRDALEEAVKRQRNAEKDAVKVGRARLALPSGVTIVVSGEGLSLDGLIESLAEAAKESKVARAQGLDIKTMQAVFKDKARPAGS